MRAIFVASISGFKRASFKSQEGMALARAGCLITIESHSETVKQV